MNGIMSIVQHAGTFLPSEILESIRGQAVEAEQLRALHPAQLNRIYRERWFKMFVPRHQGGLELSLPQAVKTEEALAWADGSTAWVVTLCSGAGWFVGFLDPGLSNTLFSGERLCLSGSGASTGTAELTEGGYVINGEWKYASGALHATAFTANCILTRGGSALTDEEGKDQIRAFLFLPSEITLKKSWNSMGMVATGSHSFSIADRFVSENRSFIIDAQHAILPYPVYRFPFLQFAEATLVVNISGMAQRFLDLIEMIFAERMAKTRAMGKDLLALHKSSDLRFQSCRNKFYEAIEQAWSLCESSVEIPGGVLDAVSATSRELYLTSLAEVQSLYRYGGLTTANATTEINRVWRNLHTASQHSLFSMT